MLAFNENQEVGAEGFKSRNSVHFELTVWTHDGATVEDFQRRQAVSHFLQVAYDHLFKLVGSQA